MKISKTTAAVAAGILIVFVVTVLYLYNRSVSQLEATMIGALKAKLEREALAKFTEKEKEFGRQQAGWIAASTLAGKAYSKKSQEAESERRAKEDARRANASLNSTWEQKFKNCNDAQKKTIEDWKASDVAIGIEHSKEVGALRSQVVGLTIRVGDLTAEIKGTFDEQGKLIKPGYIQDLFTARAETAIAKGKAKRAFWRGFLFGAIGGSAAGVKVGIAL